MVSMKMKGGESTPNSGTLSWRNFGKKWTWNDSSSVIFLMGTGGPGVNPLLSGSYCLVWVLIPDCLSLFSFPNKFCLSPYLAICNSWRWSVHMLWKFLFLSLKTSYEFPNEMFFFHILYMFCVPMNHMLSPFHHFSDMFIHCQPLDTNRKWQKLIY